MAGGHDLEYSDESWYHMVLDDTPGYIEEHETRIDEALEQNPDKLVIRTVLEPVRDEDRI